MNKRKYRKAWLAAISAAVAATVAACGGGGGSSGSSGGSGSGPIVVGAIAGTTGAYGSTGQAVINGTQMAIDEVNSKGGVLGRQFKLLSGNDGASATTSALLFRKYAGQGAVAMFGSPDTATTTVEQAERMKLPDLGAIDDCGSSIYPDGPDKPPSKWAWCTSLNTFAWGSIIGTFATQNCPNGLAVLHDPTFYGEAGLAGIQQTYKQPLKLNHSISEDWSSGSTASLDSEINAVKSSGASCVDVWLTPQDQAAFVNEMHSLGASFTVMGNDETSADNTFAKLAGNNADGMLSAVLTTDYRPNAQVEKFKADYKKRFHVESTPFAELSFDAVGILAQAIKAAKSTDAAQIQAQLDKISNFPGLTGSLSFTPQEHATITAKQLTLVRYSTAKQAWEPANS
jgi:branched-chain amino acid transport system substrate-binding protein